MKGGGKGSGCSSRMLMTIYFRAHFVASTMGQGCIGILVASITYNNREAYKA